MLRLNDEGNGTRRGDAPDSSSIRGLGEEVNHTSASVTVDGAPFEARAFCKRAVSASARAREVRSVARL